MIGNKSCFLAAIVAIFLTGMIGITVFQTQAADEVPLPKDINIVPPSPDLPKEIAAFSGKWKGSWMIGRASRRSILIIEEIDNKEAKIIFAVGVSSASASLKTSAVYRRYKAKVIAGSPPKIEFITEEKSEITFEMKKDLKSLGAYYIGGRTGVRNVTVYERFE